MAVARMMTRFLVLTVLLSQASIAADRFGVAITPAGFDPGLLRCDVGDTVRWTNETPSVQSVTIGLGCLDDGQLESGDIAAAAYFEYVIDLDGGGSTYPYFSRYSCPGIEGVFIVGDDLPVEETTWGRVRLLYQ
jgi:plastocyanin